MNEIEYPMGIGQDYDCLGAYEKISTSIVPSIEAVLADKAQWHFLTETYYKGEALDIAAAVEEIYGGVASIEEEMISTKGRLDIPLHLQELDPNTSDWNFVVRVYRVFAKGKGG